MARASKAKGCAGQNEVRDMHIAILNLEPEDVKNAIMGETGQDVRFYGTARLLVPWEVEVKRTEKTSPWEWIKQAGDRCKTQYAIWFRRNRSEWHVILKGETFLKMQKELNELRSKDNGKT